MKYRIFATRTYDKSLKNISPKAKAYIEEKIFILESKPFKGEPLRKKLKVFYSLHFKYQKTEYRAVYTVNKRKKEVMLRYTASRENIYKRVRRLKL